jgi:threonine/homoserine/homoserine lactone efflux protein
MLLDSQRLGVFLAAAIVLAIAPGPGMFYVLTRSLRGGRAEGLTSSLGTGVGGLAHVIAAAFGLSAVLATSALAFQTITYAGAAYLIYLGITTLRGKHDALEEQGAEASAARGGRRAFQQGVVTEALNPKTALFFLAFLPQFIDPARPAIPQFLILGALSVGLNTAVDVLVACFAGPLGQWLRAHPRGRRAQRRLTGWALIGLGVYVALGDRGRP